MSDELKPQPCPFCNGRAELSFEYTSNRYVSHHKDNYVVYCRNPDTPNCMGKKGYCYAYHDAHVAITEWNRRAPAAPAVQEPARTLRKLMARLADLLDEDQFAECESIVKTAGITPQTTVPQDYEARRAIMEGERNDACYKYFQARPRLNPFDKAPFFEAGFQRGFERGIELRPQSVPQDAKDAERYRYLRSTTKAIRDDDGNNRTLVTPEEFDAAIDAGIDAAITAQRDAGKGGR